LTSVQSQLQGVRGNVVDNSDVSAKKIVEKAKLEIEEFSNLESKIKMPQTFSNLGNIVKGIFPHHIWMIGGFSGVGKSYFTLQLLSDLITSSTDSEGKVGLKTIIFSTENSAVDNLLRLVGCRTGMDFIDIKTGNITDEQKKRVELEMEVLSKTPILIYDNVFDIDQMEAIVTMHRMRNECDIVMIDYVQQFNSWESDVYKRMSRVAEVIQQTALKNDVSIMCVSQISNEEASRGGSKMGSFKGAGELRNILDVGIWLEKGISEEVRQRFKDEFGEDDTNPLMVREQIAGSYNSKFVDRDNDEIICAYVNKVRHARPGMAMFEFFTDRCRKKLEQYIMKIDTEISDEDAVDMVNTLDI
jgi:replicative DNA helicase